MTIRPLLVIGVGLVVLAGGAACRSGAAGTPAASGTGGSSPTLAASDPVPTPTSDAPSPTSGPAHTTPTRPATAVCVGAHVKVTASTGQGAAGTLVQRFVVTNTASAPCTMNGHPFLSLYGPAKQGGATVEANLDLTVTPIPANFGQLGVHGGTQTLAPGGSAVFFLKWSQVPVGDKPCAVVDGFDFRPPQDSGQNKLVPFHMQPCGAGVQVSEILPPSVQG